MFLQTQKEKNFQLLYLSKITFSLVLNDEKKLLFHKFNLLKNTHFLYYFSKLHIFRSCSATTWNNELNSLKTQFSLPPA